MKAQWTFILILIFALVTAIFAVINVEPVQVHLLFTETTAPLILIILSSTLLGGLIVERDIHDFDYNHTRFLVLSEHVVPQFESAQYKTTLMITLPSDHAGALHQVLSAFAWRRLNLSKIESRPMKTGIGNYFFIIDLEMKLDEVLVPGAIAELEALGCGVKVLGSYPSFMVDIN